MTSKPSPDRLAPLHLTAHRGLEGLQALRDDWLRLTEADERYWLSFAWQEAYLRNCFGAANDVVYYALRDDQGRVLAILPMEPTTAFVRRVPFSCLQIVGSLGNGITFLASGADFPADSPTVAAEALRQLISGLRGRPNAPALVLIGRASMESTALIAARLLGVPSHAQVAVGGWRWLDVNRPYERVSASLSGKFKISLRSCHRNLAATGNVSVGCSTVGGPSFDNDYREFLTVESSGWKGVEGTRSGLLVDPTTNQRRFIETLARPEGALSAEVHWMRLNGNVIAAQLWFRYRHTRIAFKIGYLEEFAKYQPGHLLLAHIIRESCTDPTIRSIDFISGFAWLDKWRCETTPHHYCYIPVRPLLGRLASALLRLPTFEGLQARVSRLRERGKWKHAPRSS